MTTIASSELSARIEEVLARVRAGETVLVAEGGTPVARIAPCSRDEALEAAFPGIRRATQHARDIHFGRIPLPPGVDVLDTLEEVRGDSHLLP